MDTTPETKKNVEAFSVKPTGPYLLLVAETKPAKSASGVIYHAADVDEVLRRGRVIEVGPDVKRVKKGDRILYLYNGAIEVEQFYRQTYSENTPAKYMLEEKHIIGVIKEAAVDSKDENVVCCLKPEEMTELRLNSIAAEQRAHSMQQPGRILRPGRMR